MALIEVDRALAGLRPTLPISLEDAAAVWDRLRPLVSAPMTLDVYHDHKQIVVQVKLRGESVLRRELWP